MQNPRVQTACGAVKVGLTTRLRTTLTIIEAAPGISYRELARRLGRSVGNAHDAVGRLVERGHVRRVNGKLRPVGPTIKLGRVKYFRFDDETKALVEWRP